ncbi:MAG: MinD/ParA family protein [Thermodesulfobacteriota bacterium]
MNQAETLEKIMAETNQKNRREDRNSSIQQPRVISVTSGKGGVGKTNIVTNLGYCLADLGKDILILDADLNLANVDVLLGLYPKYNLHHVFLGEKKLNEILLNGPGGIRILPASSGIMEMENLSEEQKMFFLSEIKELNYQLDFLLIDTAAGLNSNVIYFTLAARERIIILTPEPTSLTDAYAMIKVLSSKHGIKRFRILVNFVTSKQEALRVYQQLTKVADRFLGTISLDYLGHLPRDAKLTRAVRSQQLVTVTNPDCPVSKIYYSLARKIISEKPDLRIDGNIQFFWQDILSI